MDPRIVTQKAGAPLYVDTDFCGAYTHTHTQPYTHIYRSSLSPQSPASLKVHESLMSSPKPLSNVSLINISSELIFFN